MYSLIFNSESQGMVVSPGFRSEKFSVTIRAIAYARKEDGASKVTYFMSVQCTLIIIRLIRLRFSLLLNFSPQLHQRIHLRFLLEGGSPKRNGVADWCKRMRRRLHLRVRGKGSVQPLHPPTPPPPPHNPEMKPSCWPHQSVTTFVIGEPPPKKTWIGPCTSNKTEYFEESIQSESNVKKSRYFSIVDPNFAWKVKWHYLNT